MTFEKREFDYKTSTKPPKNDFSKYWYWQDNDSISCVLNPADCNSKLNHKKHSNEKVLNRMCSHENSHTFASS